MKRLCGFCRHPTDDFGCPNCNPNDMTLESRLAAAERERDELIGMREEVLHYQREFHRLRDERDEARVLLREAREEWGVEPELRDRIDAFLAKLGAKP